MMRKQSSRTRLRLQFATWVTLVLVGAAMVHKQCYYDQGGWWWVHPLTTGPWDGNHRFGWPKTFVASPAYSTSDDTWIHETNQFFHYLREWIWNTDIDNAAFFSSTNLAVNFIVSLSLVFGAAAAMERHFPHRDFPLRISLKTLVTMAAWVAICVHILKNAPVEFWGHSVINPMAFFIFIVAIGLCCFTAVDLIGMAFNWASGRQMVIRSRNKTT